MESDKKHTGFEVEDYDEKREVCDKIVHENSPAVKKILITGAGGFIGSHLVAELQDECEEMVALDIKRCNDWKIYEMKNVESIRCRMLGSFDMNTRSELCSLITSERPDVILNFAGIPIPKLYVTDTENVIESVLHSFISLKNAIESMKFFSSEPYNPLIIQASTSEVYGDSETYIEDESPRIYGDFSSRRWCYAISKAMVEEILAGSRMRWIVLRLFNIVGPNIDSWGEGRVLTKMIGAALQGDDIIVTGDGTQVRAFTHIVDFMTMMKEVIKLYEPGCRHENQIFNIGGVGNAISMIDLAHLIQMTIKGRTGVDVSIQKMSADKFYGKKFSDIQYRVPDMTKWDGHFSFRPKIPMSRIIDEMVVAAAEHYQISVVGEYHDWH